MRLPYKNGFLILEICGCQLFKNNTFFKNDRAGFELRIR
jgi:hypothetical protein